MSLLTLLPILAGAQTGYWLRARGTPYCIDVPGGHGNLYASLQTWTCQFDTNEMQWGFDFQNKGIFWMGDPTKCINSNNSNNPGQGVWLGSCLDQGRFFIETVGGEKLVLVGQGQCLATNSPTTDGIHLTTETCNDQNTDEGFDFLLGSPGDTIHDMLMGQGCYKGSGVSLSSLGTAASCALAASYGGYPYFGMSGSGLCNGMTAVPSARGPTCGPCANATNEICGGQQIFVYQTPTCPAACLGCYSGTKCGKCTSGYLLINGDCTPAGSRLCLAGGRSLAGIESSTECWNPTTRSWDMDPALALPIPLSEMTSWISPNDGVTCVAGGVDGAGNYSKKVWCLNNSMPWSGEGSPHWVTGADLPGAAALMSIIYLPDPYLVGGTNGTFLQRVLHYNGAAWQNKPAMKTLYPRRGAVPFNYGGEWCVWGGDNSPTSGECWNGSAWSEPSFSIPSGVVDGVPLDYGQGPCIGGGSLGVVVQCLNITANVWILSPNEITAGLNPTGNQNRFQIDGIWCYSATRTVFCWNGTWVQYPNLLVQREHFAVVNYEMVATLSPTSYPTVPPTPAPTTVTPAIVFDFAPVLIASRWATFAVSPQPSVGISWGFPSSRSIQTANTSLVQLPPFSFAAPNQPSFTFSEHNLAGVIDTNLDFMTVWAPLQLAITGGDKEVASGSVVQINATAIDETTVAIIAALNSTSGPSPPTLGLVFVLDASSCSAVTLGSSTASSTSKSFSLQTNPVTVDTTCILSVSANDSLGRTLQVPVQFVVRNNMQFTLAMSATSGNSKTAVLNQIPTSLPLRLLATPTPVPPMTVSDLNPTNLVYQWAIIPALPTPCSSVSLSGRAVVIPGGCLLQNTSYLISVNSTLTPSLVRASAWFVITTAIKPTGGTCTVIPTVGEALSTEFAVLCSGWSTPSSSNLFYSLKYVDPTAAFVALSLRQTLPTFYYILLPLLNSNTSGSVQLVVYIWTDSGDFTIMMPPAVTVTSNTALPCPFPMSVPTTEGLIAIVASFSPPQAAISGCSSATKQTAWNQLWSWVQNAILQTFGYLDDDALQYLSNALEAVLKAGYVEPTSITTPNNFVTTLATLLEVLLTAAASSSVNSTAAVVRVVAAGIPALVTSTSSVKCTALDSVLAQTALAVQGSLANQLPGESALQFTTGISTSTSQSYFSDIGSTLATDSSSSLLALSLPTALLGLAGNVAQVQITDFSAVLSSCRPTTDDLSLVGPVVDITLSSPDGTVSANNIAGGFSFRLPLSGSNTGCGKLYCVWWDPTSQDWTSLGCVSSSDSGSVLCTCTHLTEFSLLLRPGCVSKQYEAVYYVLMGVYLLIAVVTAIKLFYRLSARWSTKGDKKCATTALVFQHALILLLAAARAAVCATLASNRQDWTVPTRAVVLVLPYLLIFWIYTLMVFQWSSLYHWGMQSQGKAFGRVKWVFVASNLCMSGAIIAMLVVMATLNISDTNTDSQNYISTNPSDSNNNNDNSAVEKATVVVQAAAAVIASVTFITAISFLTYATLLYRTMSIASRSTNPSMRKNSARNLQPNNNSTRNLQQLHSNNNSLRVASSATSELNSNDNGHPDLSSNSNSNVSDPTRISLSTKLQSYCCSSTVSVHHKILFGGITVCTMLCLEAILHVVSSVAHSQASQGQLMEGDASEVVALVADVLCLVTLLWMYHRAMSQEGRKRAPQQNVELSTKQQQASMKKSLGRNISVDHPSVTSLAVDKQA